MSHRRCPGGVRGHGGRRRMEGHIVSTRESALVHTSGYSMATSTHCVTVGAYDISRRKERWNSASDHAKSR